MSGMSSDRLRLQQVCSLESFLHPQMYPDGADQRNSSRTSASQTRDKSLQWEPALSRATIATPQ